ncbi:hypothetical protein STEG23_029206 [Scotinomys teguina]
MKTNRSDPSEKISQSIDNVMDFQDSSNLLGSEMTLSARQPHRSSENVESIHAKKRNYKCSGCGKTFSHNFRLIRHQKIHTGERPFKCTQCGKSFRQNAHLVVHLRVHTGEKHFQCSKCGRAFSYKSSLTHHLNTHSGKHYVFKLLSVVNVGNYIGTKPASYVIIEFILEKSPLCAANVGNHIETELAL